KGKGDGGEDAGEGGLAGGCRGPPNLEAQTLVPQTHTGELTCVGERRHVAWQEEDFPDASTIPRHPMSLRVAHAAQGPSALGHTTASGHDCNTPWPESLPESQPPGVGRVTVQPSSPLRQNGIPTVVAGDVMHGAPEHPTPPPPPTRQFEANGPHSSTPHGGPGGRARRRDDRVVTGRSKARGGPSMGMGLGLGHGEGEMRAAATATPQGGTPTGERPGSSLKARGSSSG
ncbi:unnamed protein product, partial [Discosporangium mesarthrocarpum]